MAHLALTLALLAFAGQIDRSTLPEQDSCRLATAELVVVGEVGERLKTERTAVGLRSSYDIAVIQVAFGECDVTKFRLVLDGGVHLHPKLNVLVETEPGLVATEGERIVLGLSSCPVNTTIRNPVFFGRLRGDHDELALSVVTRDAVLKTEFGSLIPQHRLRDYVVAIRKTHDPCGVAAMREYENMKREKWREMVEEQE